MNQPVGNYTAEVAARRAYLLVKGAICAICDGTGGKHSKCGFCRGTGKYVSG